MSTKIPAPSGVSRKRTVPRRLFMACLLVSVVGLIALGGLAYALDRFGRTPREWAPYLDRRARNHNPIIVHTVSAVTAWLRYADGLPGAGQEAVTWTGASTDRPMLPTPPLEPRQLRLIGSVEQLREALRSVQPGDVLEMLPGTYRIGYPALSAAAAGRAGAPITLRAARLGFVTFESDTVEAFSVRGPYWVFENLDIRGVCGSDADCEHAFHVVAGASHVVIRNNRLTDFNAHLKINGENGSFPDDGRIEFNTITDDRPRSTSNPVTPIDMVGNDGWVVSGNLITDFIKADGDDVSYGAFAKGAGSHNMFEGNVVLCEDKLRGFPGERIGLSFGGGGTGAEYRRDIGKSGLEQSASIMRDNLIAFCSDVGIYLNRSAGSAIEGNTLIDTAGIVSRFPESSAEISNNIVDGVIRGRDGGGVSGGGNAQSPLLGLFLGWHPQRALFSDPARLNLAWRDPPPQQPGAPGVADLCGKVRGAMARPGAFDDFSGCLFPGSRR